MSTISRAAELVEKLNAGADKEHGFMIEGRAAEETRELLALLATTFGHPLIRAVVSGRPMLPAIKSLLGEAYYPLACWEMAPDDSVQFTGPKGAEAMKEMHELALILTGFMV